MDPRYNFDGVVEMVSKLNDLLKGPEGQLVILTTKVEMENTLDTLFIIYYEKYANKESTSFSTSNVAVSSVTPSSSKPNWALESMTRTKQKGCYICK